MPSEHQPTNPVSSEDLQAENRRLREQIDAARDAVVPIKAGVVQLAAAFEQGPDYRERCRVAAKWVDELLTWPTSRPGTIQAVNVDGLHDELHGILDVLTARGGDRS
jgi:hypothetical protein